MEISDLATSAGINIGLATLFLILYSIFRKQPGNAGVYSTRQMLRDQRKEVKEREPFSIQKLLPSPGWVTRAWNPSEDDIMESAGLDAVVFLRIFKFCIRFFTICTLVGCGILAPLNYNDTYISDHSSGKKDETGTLEKLTILNISQGSSRLWFHLAVLYFISFTAYTLLYLEYKSVGMLRQAYLMSASPQPDQFSVLVRGIPKPEKMGETYSEKVEAFFVEFHPLHYLSHQMVFRSSELQCLLKMFDKEKAKIVALRAKLPSERQKCRTGFLGLYGPLMDPLHYHNQRLEELYEKIREHQSDIYNRKEELPAAFVSFKTRWESVVTAQTQQAVNPMLWVTEWAPEPRDVDWDNLKIGYRQLLFRTIFFSLAASLITLFYIPVTTAIQALANIDSLLKFLPTEFVEALYKIPGTKQVLQGFVPALLTAGVLYLLPPIYFTLAKFAGYISISRQERKTSGYVFNLLAGNVFLVGVLGGSMLSILDTFSSEPREIPRHLAEAIPSRANFFITYILTTGWAGFPLEILQFGTLVLNFMKRLMVDRTKPLLSDVYSLPYYRHVPNVLMFILIGLTYSIITPLLLPFLLVYFILGYIVFRNQILYVYEPTYETGGQFWPHVHIRIIASLVLLQVCFIGVFSVKGLGRGSFIAIPLPILTLLFNEHCRHRFFPAFRRFNLETTVKKDQGDAQSGKQEEIWEVIRTAYRHPALRPLSMDESSILNTETLLPSTSASV